MGGSARRLRFGGQLWAKLLLAFGTVPRRCVEIFNDVVAQRAADGQALAAAQGAQHAVRGSGSSRAERRASKKAARWDSKRASKRARRFFDDSGKWHDMPARERWEEDEGKVQDVGAVAEGLSEQSGCVYENRRGELVEAAESRRPGMLEMVIERYLAECDAEACSGGRRPRLH